MADQSERVQFEYAVLSESPACIDTVFIHHVYLTNPTAPNWVRRIASFESLGRAESYAAEQGELAQIWAGGPDMWPGTARLDDEHEAGPSVDAPPPFRIADFLRRLAALVPSTALGAALSPVENIKPAAPAKLALTDADRRYFSSQLLAGARPVDLAAACGLTHQQAHDLAKRVRAEAKTRRVAPLHPMTDGREFQVIPVTNPPRPETRTPSPTTVAPTSEAPTPSPTTVAPTPSPTTVTPEPTTRTPSPTTRTPIPTTDPPPTPATAEKLPLNQREQVALNESRMKIITGLCREDGRFYADAVLKWVQQHDVPNKPIATQAAGVRMAIIELMTLNLIRAVNAATDLYEVSHLADAYLAKEPQIAAANQQTESLKPVPDADETKLPSGARRLWEALPGIAKDGHFFMEGALKLDKTVHVAAGSIKVYLGTLAAHAIIKKGTGLGEYIVLRSAPAREPGDVIDQAIAYLHETGTAVVKINGVYDIRGEDQTEEQVIAQANERRTKRRLPPLGAGE